MMSNKRMYLLFTLFIHGVSQLCLSSLNPLLMCVGFPHVSLLIWIHEQVYTCALATHTQLSILWLTLDSCSSHLVIFFSLIFLVLILPPDVRDKDRRSCEGGQDWVQHSHFHSCHFCHLSFLSLSGLMLYLRALSAQRCPHRPLGSFSHFSISPSPIVHQNAFYFVSQELVLW